MISARPRRVVTGLDAEGRSSVLFDDDADQVIWSTDRSPADNSGRDDTAGPFSFEMPRGGSKFLISEFPPSDTMFGSGMHMTDTIDYIVVLKGQVTLVLETGDVVLHAGDVIVDRGVNHGWRNDGAEPAFIAVVMIDAEPVSLEAAA